MKTYVIEYDSTAHARRAAAAFNQALDSGLTASVVGRSIVVSPAPVLSALSGAMSRIRAACRSAVSRQGRAAARGLAG